MIAAICAAGLTGWLYGGWPLGILTGVVTWLAWSWKFPWTRCWKCGGDPKNFDPSGKNWNDHCRPCNTTGRRARVGARLLRSGFGRF